MVAESISGLHDSGRSGSLASHINENHMTIVENHMGATGSSSKINDSEDKPYIG
jgi:hypothetical protein